MHKVLSIDGGGIKGVFPASFLATIEEAIGGRVSNYFDLIVGTSTGGIIALGLGLGMSAREILVFYERYGPEIFKPRLLGRIPGLRRLSGLLTAKYDPAPLHDALQDRFGNRLIGESTVRLVIPSANLETGAVHLFKTAHHPRLEQDYKKEAVEAALATSAAPAYFPSFASDSGTPLVDGGVWANNPAAVAATEAVGVLGWTPGNVALLSLGCTSEPYNAARARRGAPGMAYWGLKAVELFMSTQSSSATGMAQHLLGKEHVLRIDPMTPRGRFQLDAAQEIESLNGLGETEARQALPELRKRFVQEPAQPFVPCHSL